MSETTTSEKRHRLREFEREIPQAIVRVEKKIVHFPFRRYFIGHRKPEEPKLKPNWRTWSNDTLTLAWLGQSTVLINFYGTWILTDPVFSERVGIPVGPLTVGPRRLVHAPLQPEELPPLDLILISHAHMDHTDLPSLQQIVKGTKGRQGKTEIIVAANTARVYESLKPNSIHEVDWDEEIEVCRNLRVTAIQVRHAGWRMPWHPCRSRKELNGMSYNAYLVKKQDEQGQWHSFVFGGDTGYIDSFHTLGERMRLLGREIECAIMPIGTYNPWVQTHCNPEQAWRMTREMNARYIVPIHWNTYTQSSEPRYEPIEWLRHVVQDPHAIALSEHGETWNKDEAEGIKNEGRGRKKFVGTSEYKS